MHMLDAHVLRAAVRDTRGVPCARASGGQIIIADVSMSSDNVLAAVDAALAFAACALDWRARQGVAKMAPSKTAMSQMGH
jgi:hypothetical protein